VLPEDGSTDEALEALRRSLPLKRIGEPADIARAVRYLLEATYVTGTELVVDGGRSLRLGE
jgi:pteridine reductase